MKIKVCGITQIEELESLINLDIDYFGFVFAKSKRQVTVQNAKYLINYIREKNKHIKTVGVFVNKNFEEIQSIKEYCNLDILQLHGDESSEYCRELIRLNNQVWKAISVGENYNKGIMNQYSADGFLIDTKGKARGGNGVAFDWEKTRELGKKYNIILAGGLNKDNVQEGIKIVSPKIVDVSSGVELNGKKDFTLVKEFIEKVKMSV